MKLAIYSVTSTAVGDEANAIVEQVNSLIASKGANLESKRAQSVLDEQVDAALQARYGLKVISTEFNMEHDE